MKDFVKCGNVALLMILVLNLMFPRGAFAVSPGGMGDSIHESYEIPSWYANPYQLTQDLFGPDFAEENLMVAYRTTEVIRSKGSYFGTTDTGEIFFIDVVGLIGISTEDIETTEEIEFDSAAICFAEIWTPNTSPLRVVGGLGEVRATDDTASDELSGSYFVPAILWDEFEILLLEEEIYLGEFELLGKKLRKHVNPSWEEYLDTVGPVVDPESDQYMYGNPTNAPPTHMPSMVPWPSTVPMCPCQHCLQTARAWCPCCDCEVLALEAERRSAKETFDNCNAARLWVLVSAIGGCALGGGLGCLKKCGLSGPGYLACLKTCGLISTLGCIGGAVVGGGLSFLALLKMCKDARDKEIERIDHSIVDEMLKFCTTGNYCDAPPSPGLDPRPESCPGFTGNGNFPSQSGSN